MSDNIIRTGLNLMNTAFNGSGGTVISGEAVKGGYFVTPSIEITYKGEEGKIPDYACVLGTLCYCTGDKKFYQYLSVSREVDGTTTTTNEWVNIELDEVVNKIDTLIGEDAEKSVRTIANEELAAQLLSDSANASFKTLQDLAKWIEGHPEDVAAINAAIALNAENITKEENRAKGVESSLESALNAEVQLRTAQINGINFSTKEEVNRALAAESGLADDLKSESLRATEAEKELLAAIGITQQLVEENKQSIAEENVRARTEEAFVSEKVDTEAARAILAEDRIRNSLIAEEQRALEAEELLREDLKTNFGEINTLLEEEVNRTELALKEYINNLLFESEFAIDCTGIGEPATKQ